MPSVRSALVLTLITFLIASCGPGPTVTEEGGWPLVFQRTGGIAGFDHRLTIGGDGTALWQDGEERLEFQVGEETRTALQAVLEAADFRQLSVVTPEPPVGADLFFYSITYDGMTVSFHDEAVPAGIEPVLNLINGIIASRVGT